MLALVCTASEPWTLERALGQALAHNPDARLAQERIAVAQAGIAQANASFWPHLSLQSSYTRTDNPMMVFGSFLNQRAVPPGLNYNDVPDADDLNVKGFLTMPLYQGGKMSATKEVAKANSKAAELDSVAVRNSLAFEVARAFHTVLKTREFIRAADAAVQSYQTNLTIAQRRLQGGTLLKTDVLDIEVRLAQAREDQVRAGNARILAERALQNLLGIEGGEFAVADAAPRVSAPASGDYTRRSELAAAAQHERAAEEQVRVATSGYKPRLSAFGSLDYDYGWKSESDGESYTAGALLQWDIWDGKLTRAKVQEARANLNAAREEKRKLRLGLSFEAEKARLELEAARQRLRVTKSAVETAAESVTLTRVRFQEGQALATQLMDAENALVSARVRRAEAESDQAIAIAAWRRALGMPQLDSMAASETK
jgi:outer membrane protein